MTLRISSLPSDAARVAPRGNKIATVLVGYKVSATLSVVCVNEQIRAWGITRNSKKSERATLMFSMIGCDENRISLLRAIARIWDFMGPTASNDQLIASLEDVGLSIHDAWDCALKNYHLGIKPPT